MLLALLFSLYRFWVGWRSYDNQIQAIKQQCIRVETPFPKSSLEFGTSMPLNLQFEKVRADAARINNYCTCVSDHAKQFLSHLDVAITVGSYKRINRFDRSQFMQSPTMLNEAKICRQAE